MKDIDLRHVLRRLLILDAPLAAWLISGIWKRTEKGISMYHIPMTHSGDKLTLQVLMQAIVLLVHIERLPWDQARSHFQFKRTEKNK